MLNPESKRLAVLGHPVAHSRSPAMHNAAILDAGLDGWEYTAIDVSPEGFEALVRDLPEQGFAGVNVTVPHKEAALAIADRASDAAREIGAANTLTFRDSQILAENTDAPGLLDILEPAPGEGLNGQKALALGAGGAGRAVVWALAGAGAEVMLWNRTHSKAESLVREMGVEVLPLTEPALDPGTFDVIVNASAAGLGSGDGLASLPLDPGGFRPGQTVVDMVYGEGPGTLLEAAEAGGAATVDGLEVLVRQGARSFEIWTGRSPDLATMRAAVRSSQR